MEFVTDVLAVMVGVFLLNVVLSSIAVLRERRAMAALLKQEDEVRAWVEAQKDAQAADS